MSFQKNKTSIIISILLVVGAFLRFYNLGWGAPYFFHPDERNIASAVSQMSYPNNFNPHFFAYGGLPIYIIFLSGIFLNFIQSTIHHAPFLKQLSFEQAIIISRFYSSLLSLLLIPLIYLTGRELRNENTGLFSAALVTICVGLIQFAHFGTFEIWLSFFSLLLFFVCINFKYSAKYFLITGIISGILVGIKVSSILLLPLPFVLVLLYLFADLKKGEGRFVNYFIKTFLYFVIFSIAYSMIYVVFNPYVFLDFASFKGSIEYESRVGLGTLPVFYTGEFIDSLPVVYQIKSILPFLLNPIMVVIFIPLLIYFINILIKEKKRSYFILLVFFLITFLTQAFLFVKWVRYIVPGIPFIILIISTSTFSINKLRVLKRFIISILIISSLIYSISYFLTVYVEKDSRLQALEFAKKNIPPNSQILSEVYDMGIVPFNESYLNISLFNFYDLDSNSSVSNEEHLKTAIANNRYIILPSQRIYSVRILKSDEFPVGGKFYQELLSGKLGFKKIYETPCSIFCKIAYSNDSAYSYEQTANVFDRPNIMIFRKE